MSCPRNSGVASSIAVPVGDTDKMAGTIVLFNCSPEFFQLITAGICGDGLFCPGLVDPVAAAVVFEDDISARLAGPG